MTSSCLHSKSNGDYDRKYLRLRDLSTTNNNQYNFSNQPKHEKTK